MFHLPDGMIGGSLETDFGSEVDGTARSGTGQLIAQAQASWLTQSVTRLTAHLSLLQKAMTQLAIDHVGHAGGRVRQPSRTTKAKSWMLQTHRVRKIYPGELAKGLEILANGGDIGYAGASAVELMGPGGSSGSCRQIAFEGGKNDNREVPLISRHLLIQPGPWLGLFFCKRRSKRSYR